MKKTRLAALLLAGSLLLPLTACAAEPTGSLPAEPSSSEPSIAPEEPSRPEEPAVKITPTAAKSMETEVYETADFTMTIPKGWQVLTGGANINSYIYVTDPDDLRNGMFLILKMEPLLHCQAGKDAWKALYDSGDQTVAMFAEAPVLETPSTENYFKLFYDDFTVTDRFPSTSGYGAFSLGDEILRATFTDSAGEMEGLFTASIVDFGAFPISDGTVINYQLQTVDGGYYMAYNVMGITAAKDTLIEWEGLLASCLNSLQYSDSFINATNQASDDQLALSRQISQNFNASMDGLMSSWENRNKSQDILSQKQSDATLGYERVYDTETNEVYKATNGFTDVYDGTRFQPVTDDDMYTQPISGYIEQE